jgi:DNA-directed RNA polymerase specialized sigma24 family protein
LPETPLTFRAIYDGYFDFVWRFAGSCGVPLSSLEAVVHEVFVLVHAQLDGSEQAAALKIGIAGVARNVVRSHLRKRGKPSPAPGQARELGEPESAAELVDVILSQMKDLQREAFVLCEIEGLSGVEAAAALRLNEPTLRVVLHDARRVFNALSAELRAQRFWVTREGENLP